MIKKTQQGFTLIELMIVVAIIGILASIAIPQFASFRVKAFDAAGSSDLKNGNTTIEAAYNEDYKYPVVAKNVTSAAMALGTQTWTSSDGVTIGHYGASAASYTIAAKHLGGAQIFTKTESGGITKTAGTEGTALVTTDF